MSYWEATDIEDRSQGAESTVSLAVRNARAVEVSFCLEPWGEAYPMAAGAIFQIEARGPQGGNLEVEVADDRIIVYGWSGSVVSVFHEGVEIGGRGASCIPVPETPPSMSVADFLRRILGPPDEPPLPTDNT